MAGKGRTEKISVTLPRESAAEIRCVVPRGEVSSFFAKALEHYLAYRKQKVALEKGFGAWKDEDHPDLATPRDSEAYVRSIREAPKLSDDGGKISKTMLGQLQSGQLCGT